MLLRRSSGRVVELVRRLVKLFLYVFVCRGIVSRYMQRRGEIMSALASRGLYESQYFSHLERFVSPGDTVVDVGAHFGAYTEKLARMVGEAGRVVAIEPLRDCSEWLRTLAQRFPQVGVYEVALGDGSDVEPSRTFYVPLLFGFVPEPALASLVKPSGQHVALSVPVATLDGLLPELPKVSFIKLDVEGAEFEVLGGASRLVRASRPRILLEVTYPEQVWESIQEFCDSYRYYPLAVKGSDLIPVKVPKDVRSANIFLFPMDMDTVASDGIA